MLNQKQGSLEESEENHERQRIISEQMRKLNASFHGNMVYALDYGRSVLVTLDNLENIAPLVRKAVEISKSRIDEFRELNRRMEESPSPLKMLEANIRNKLNHQGEITEYEITWWLHYYYGTLEKIEIRTVHSILALLNGTGDKSVDEVITRARLDLSRAGRQDPEKFMERYMGKIQYARESTVKGNLVDVTAGPENYIVDGLKLMERYLGIKTSDMLKAKHTPDEDAEA